MNAIIFIIDISDDIRFTEAKIELDYIINDIEIEHLPILILGNKIDKSSIKSEHEILKIFALNNLRTGKVFNKKKLIIILIFNEI